MRIFEAQVRDIRHGENFTVVTPSNLYECTFGDDCFVGPFCEVQSGVRIGNRTRIQSHSFICSLVSIGDDCFVGHGVMFINDDFRSGGASREAGDWRSTSIGNHVSIGSNASIMPVKICDHVIIGAGSVVTHDITASGTYVGNPARKIK